MDFKVNRETLSVSETVFDGSSETSVELDYVLPDYYPDIFKLIKCLVTPSVVQSSVNGDKISYELSVVIRILYCADQSAGHGMQCVEQKLAYTKTIDLGKHCENPMITLVPKVDYANCRVVNSHRVDVRGAVTVRCRVVCENKQPAVCDAFGGGIQLRKHLVPCAGSKHVTSKRIEVAEEFDLGYAKPSIQQIIRCDASVLAADKKVIANKLVAKGEIQLSLLYTCDKEGHQGMESMRFTLPFSQVMELEGVDERYTTILNVHVVGCEMTPKTNPDGEEKLIDVKLSLLLDAVAVGSATAELAVDAYSTKHPCTYSSADARIEKLPRELSGSVMVAAAAHAGEGTSINCVYDAWCEVQGVSSQISPEGELTVMGNLHTCVMIKDAEGLPMMLESADPFEWQLKGESLSPNSRFDPTVQVVSCSYGLQAPSSVEVKAELRINGTLWDWEACSILTDIQPDFESAKTAEEDHALKLYFADAGESIWDIAKRYSISVDAVLYENELEDQTLTQRSMLLIPME